jgi:mRNA interferase MazF
MILCEKWDVILVPFPFTDLSQSKKRPAVILTDPDCPGLDDVVIGFLTSNLATSLKPSDYNISLYPQAGLPLPTRFKLKLATINRSIIVKRLGSLELIDREGISRVIRQHLG